ncbi:Initiation-specific alpha-1,6-mannosyltransferase [Erysiphe neolycopersici]|uniref:Initiation-specific alpha-1,6-mannosyltransferase n=1 Tax=Erysiphe neolycopersici TaxID=212602 RepID=A0A420HNP4_9PEZI|nr:Initiation-specific alpha-1,6-mannosyltransferase [Erysiphe neolycopersici]
MFRLVACNRSNCNGLLRGRGGGIRIFHILRPSYLKTILLVPILLATILFYLVILRRSGRSRWTGMEYGPAPARKELHSYPIYEYTSIYRLQADLQFEEALNEKLTALETNTLTTHDSSTALNEETNWNSSSSGNRRLLANHTIWQIATPREKKLWSTWATQWSNSNPDWAHIIRTSTPDDLSKVIQSFPEIEDAIRLFPYIQKDLIRHLLLWYYGGFYASIDTWSRVALHDCIPISTVLRSNDTKIGLMIGVATDEPFLSYKTMEQWGWLRSFGFSQDVVWAPLRFNSLLKTAIVRSISHARTHEALRENLGIGFETKQKLVEEISGPAMFTDVVLESLSYVLSKDNSLRDPDAGIARRVTWKKFSKLKKPIWIEGDSTNRIQGLVILPINVWTNGQDHSRAGSDSVADACVNQPHGKNLRKTWLD